MLNVYIGDIKSENLVKFNDAWFDNITIVNQYALV